MSLDFIKTDLGAKFLDMCAYVIKSELPSNYLYEFVSNRCVTHATIRDEKWQAAKALLESKGYKVVNRNTTFKQIDIFTGLEIASPTNSEQETKTLKVSEHNLNPCECCDLREWCGADDCAKKGYPIDMPTTRFKNLEEMITYFRTHDILGL